MDIFLYLKEEKQCFNSSLVQVCMSATEQFSFRRTGSLKAELLHIKTNWKFQVYFTLLYSKFNTGRFCWKDIYSCVQRCWAPLNRGVGTLMPWGESQGESTSQNREQTR